jgi:hypothetical protein
MLRGICEMMLGCRENFDSLSYPKKNNIMGGFDRNLIMPKLEIND